MLKSYLIPGTKSSSVPVSCVFLPTILPDIRGLAAVGFADRTRQVRDRSQSVSRCQERPAHAMQSQPGQASQRNQTHDVLERVLQGALTRLGGSAQVPDINALVSCTASWSMRSMPRSAIVELLISTTVTASRSMPGFNSGTFGPLLRDLERQSNLTHRRLASVRIRGGHATRRQC